MSLPKFDFSKMDLTEDKLNEQIEADKKANKQFFKPGKHEVKIKGLEYKGAVESDPTWQKVRILFEGTYNKEISDLLMLPTSDVIMTTKDGVKSTFPYRKLKDFMATVGVELNLNNLGQVLSKYFGGDKPALVGLDLSIEAAYTGPHVKFQGKDANGNNTYQVVNRREEPLLDGKIFADHKEANAAAKEEGIAVEGFVNITKYLSSSTPNGTAAQEPAKKDNW